MSAGADIVPLTFPCRGHALVGVLHMPGGHTFYGPSYVSPSAVTGREEGVIRGIRSELWMDDGSDRFQQTYNQVQTTGIIRGGEPPEK